MNYQNIKKLKQISGSGYDCGITVFCTFGQKQSDGNSNKRSRFHSKNNKVDTHQQYNF